jgi:peptidyl-prolyl cis-trans isomerase B (cyclophilin B)
MNKAENAVFKHKFDSLKQAKNNYAANQLASEFGKQFQSRYAEIDKMELMTAEQKNIYSTVGGAPHLDGGYTVFGEVVSGMDVIDKISAVETGQYDRPKQDIKIKKMKIIK